jgi:mannitol PTS system EIICBA or EIICB component
MSDAVLAPKSAAGARVGLQRFGSFVSGMVLPNIGAFLAWGLITAFFIPTGWVPNENLAKLVGPILSYLLPLLIGYTGGRAVHGVRGGVMGAIVTLGVICGASIPMLLGAMIVGPASALLLKKFDELLEGHIATGFEMLVNNFSLGIIGAVLALLAYLVIGPAIGAVSAFLAGGVKTIVSWNILPLANLFIEPGKVLFLNNAINHGILGPIGIQQAATAGKSVVFMLESNPGPGLGLLLAYWVAGKGLAKESASSAIIVHFFGGIHEIYFPYILMNPKLILATMAGGVVGTFTFVATGAGLVATPSPGSIFAYIAMTPKGELLPVMAGVVTATAASFAVAFLLLKFGKQNEDKDGLKNAVAATAALKGSKLNAATAGLDTGSSALDPSSVKKIIFSCDAGMGSSAMGASILRKKVKEAGLKITVSNTAINEIPADADIVVSHKSLTDRARRAAPNAHHISIDDFLKSPEYDKLVERLKS